MHYSNHDIGNLDRIRRLNLINSISGIKPANLIGTISPEGHTNLAIFSSIVHLGSNPPLLGFVLRPHKEVRRHTYDNILSNGFYTINHINTSMVKRAHYTSAKFEKDVSEFEACNFLEEYLFDFRAPFVKESRIKMALQLKECIKVTANNTMMIVGEIQHLVIPDEMVNDGGHIDLDKVNGTGISGLNSYYQLNKIAQFPYARVSELPDLGQE